VWIETKINKDSIRKGFYRPPDAKLTHWNSVDESITKVGGTPHRIVILSGLMDFPVSRISSS